MNRLPLVLLTALGLSLTSSSNAQTTERERFDSHMRAFESAKQKGDMKAAEVELKQALRYGQTDYAAHSLAWVYQRQRRFEEAYTLSHDVVRQLGPTPITLMGLVGAAVDVIELGDAKAALAEANKRGFLQGHGWVSDTLRRQVDLVREMSEPAVYDLTWSIPRSTWDKAGKARTFIFPVKRHTLQTMDYQIDGTATLTDVSLPGETAYAIAPLGDGPVVVKARATLLPDLVPLRERKRIAAWKMASPDVILPALYYGREKIDPNYAQCRELASMLRKANAWETMQAILDWRMANITYAQPPAGNTLETILSSKTGVCHHSAYLAASLARAVGIDAVVVGGFVLPDKGEFKEVEGSHGWTEFKIPGGRWIEFESQDGNSLGKFMARKHYLRYRAQDATSPEVREAISCQGFKVSGKRIR